MFIASVAGTIVPHHVPYNLQGNIHLILAYLSFGVIASITYMNVFTHYNRMLMNGFTLMLCILVICFMKFMMINIVAELCAMTYVLFANVYLYCKYTNKNNTTQNNSKKYISRLEIKLDTFG